MHSRLHAEIVAHLPHRPRGYGSLIVKPRIMHQRPLDPPVCSQYPTEPESLNFSMSATCAFSILIRDRDREFATVAAGRMADLDA